MKKEIYIMWTDEQDEVVKKLKKDKTKSLKKDLVIKAYVELTKKDIEDAVEQIYSIEDDFKRQQISVQNHHRQDEVDKKHKVLKDWLKGTRNTNKIIGLAVFNKILTDSGYSIDHFSTLAGKTLDKFISFVDVNKTKKIDDEVFISFFDELKKDCELVNEVSGIPRVAQRFGDTETCSYELFENKTLVFMTNSQFKAIKFFTGTSYQSVGIMTGGW